MLDRLSGDIATEAFTGRVISSDLLDGFAALDSCAVSDALDALGLPAHRRFHARVDPPSG